MITGRKNKGASVKKSIPAKRTMPEQFETKPDKYETMGKRSDVKTVKKGFDLPIVNAVHNNWLEKKLKEQSSQETTMVISPQEPKQKLNISRKKTNKKSLEPVVIKPHKYEIVEYEIIEPM